MGAKANAKVGKFNLLLPSHHSGHCGTDSIFFCDQQPKSKRLWMRLSKSKTVSFIHVFFVR